MLRGSFRKLGQRIKKNSFRKSIVLGLLTVLICIGIGNFTPSAANPTLVARNLWQTAVFPVENFQAYTSGFGYRIHPVTGNRQFHYGLDIAAPLGSYIRNWWPGKIVSLTDHTGCGTRIEIRSGQWSHIYCHLMGSVQSDGRGTFLVDREGGIVLAVGQDIPLGARMARVGMTGRTTGPHLHWELMYGGQYVDPATVIQAMYGARTEGNT